MNFNKTVVLDNINLIQTLILNGLSSSLSRAREILEDVSTEVKARQKLIRIADEKGDWKVADEYERGGIADDSADESKIRAAETRVQRRRLKPVQKRFSRPASQGFGAPFGWRPFEKIGATAMQQKSVSLGRQSYCFKCGDGSHWAKNCPMQYTVASGKFHKRFGK